MEMSDSPDSFIQVVFKEQGSILFDANVNGVTPLQFLAIGEYFKFMGEDLLRKAQVQKEQQKIAVPGIACVDDLLK
jgi:hypothetical protein